LRLNKIMMTMAENIPPLQIYSHLLLFHI
jgi:hypothetical protein